MERNTFELITTFKGKRALVGDYFEPSFDNTRTVLESLGIDVIHEKTEPAVINRVLNGEKFDVIFTNNIYQIGSTGPELLQKLKQIDGFNIPVVIHTISEMPKEYFIQLGFDGCLKKPIKQDETLELLRQIFKKVD